MSDAKVRIERDGDVALVTLDDPKTRNALTPALVGGLVEFLQGANADPTLSCIVLTGAGDGFCSGGNVKDMLAAADPMYAGSPFEMQEGYRNGIQAVPKLFHTLDVPVIGAIHGAAIGAGCDLACMCDFRIGSPTAKFAESFLRVGIVPGDGGAWFLPRVVGVPRSLEMALTCRMIEAEEAKDWGLLTRIVPAEQLIESALAMAKTIAGFPPLSIRLNKRLLKRALDMTLEGCLELSAAYQAIVQHTDDQKEAVAALVGKREPEFKRR